MRPHDLDIVSLLVGLVFVTLGGTGLLQSADVIGTGLAWPLIGAVAAVGLTGLVVSTGRLVGSPDPTTTEAGTYIGAEAGASASSDEHTGPGWAAPPLGFDTDDDDDDGETIDDGAV